MRSFRQYAVLTICFLCLLAGCKRNGVPLNWRGETPREEMAREARNKDFEQGRLDALGNKVDESTHREELTKRYTSAEDDTEKTRLCLDVKVENADSREVLPTATVRYRDETLDPQGKTSVVLKEDTLRWERGKWLYSETRTLPTPQVAASRYITKGKVQVNVAALMNKSPQAIAKILGKSIAYDTRYNFGPRFKKTLAAEICTYGDPKTEFVMIWYIKKKARRAEMTLQTGVTPNEQSPQQIARAFGIQKLSTMSPMSGGSGAYFSDNNKPFEQVLLDRFIGSDGISRCHIQFSMPGMTAM